MRIAIQGEAGSFSHEAALRMSPGCVVIPCARSAEVFDRVDRGSVNAAVIPVENSLAGSVAEHLDLLLARRVCIQREFALRIVHNLIAPPGVKKAAVHRALSHPVALDQCRNFFRANAKIEAVPFYDTAGSVKHIIAENLPNSAAIASRRAARVYGGKILLAGIEDDKRNFTRFLLIRKGLYRKSVALPRSDKTSMAFTLNNVPGALFQALQSFAARNISLSKIESRPLRGRPWEYAFYVDLLRGDDEITCSALRELRGIASSVKVLGVYPRKT